MHPLVRSHVYDSDGHDCSTFDCGNDRVNHWLKGFAPITQAKRTSRTFVWIRGIQVVGYYSLAGHRVDRDDVPSSVGRGSPDQIPAVLLTWFGLDRTMQGQGAGGALLLDALARIVASVDQGPAARIIVTDAIDDQSRRFFLHHDFKDVVGNPGTMYLKMSTAEKLIARALAENVLPRQD